MNATPAGFQIVNEQNEGTIAKHTVWRAKEVARSYRYSDIGLVKSGDSAGFFLLLISGKLKVLS